MADQHNAVSLERDGGVALLGVAGSFVASYAGQALGWYGPGEAAGFIASVVGAIVLLVVYGLVKGQG